MSKLGWPGSMVHSLYDTPTAVSPPAPPTVVQRPNSGYGSGEHFATAKVLYASDFHADNDHRADTERRYHLGQRCGSHHDWSSSME
nr:hypothetical protein [Halomonas sp.]